MLQPNEHVLDYVDPYLHDALSPRTSALVAEHCERCPICRVALDEAKRRFDATFALAPAEASEALIGAAEKRVDDYCSRSRALRIGSWFASRPPVQVAWMLAAMILVVLGVGQLRILTRSPAPYDLRVFGQTELLPGTESSLRVVLFDRSRESALAGVPVSVELAGTNDSSVVTLADFVTDAQGTGSPRFLLPDWPDGDYTLRVVARPGVRRESTSQPVKLKRSWKLMVSTDKPVYQPGQVIHVRSLALQRHDLKPMAGKEVVFTITDPKGNKIFRRRDVTSKYGITALDCPLATEIIQGTYQIVCALGDTTGVASVTVKNYVLPKFKTLISLDAPYYQPAATIRGTLQSDYFFGKPVANAEVTVVFKTTDAPEAVIKTVAARTDAAGKAEFSARLPDVLVGRGENFGDANVALDVSVTDSAGQIESKTLTRVVTNNPIRIEAVPEGGMLVKGLPNTVYLIATYADGRPVKARLAISGYQHEFATDALGVATVEVQPVSNRLEWTVRAADSDGLNGRRVLTLECGEAAEDFLVRTDRAVYSGGDTVELTTRGAGRQPVFIDLIQDGQTVFTNSIEMNEGRGSLQFELPPELFGTIDLCAYRFGAKGLPLRKSRAIYVRQTRNLHVETSFDRKEYRPGESAKLKLRLVDGDGKPTPGAISLAAVDEAVFSVSNKATGLQESYFTLEPELLRPVYAIYPWSPAAALPGTPDEQRRFEQALFASTANRRTAGRDALIRELLPLVDNDPAIFDVLDHPERERFLETSALPDKAMRILRQNDVRHTLSVSTYPEKVRQFELQQRSSQDSMKFLWGLFFVAAGFLAVYHACLAIFGRQNAAVCVVTTIVIFLLSGLLMPAVQQAREAAKRTQARNDMRQIEFAIAEFHDKHGNWPGDDETKPSPAPSVRVREWFPETLLWRPEVITDDWGNASIDVNLADSITTWRLRASAVSADGQFGTSESALRVFQPFFVDLDLPVTLTRGDEVAMPVVVYNYLDKPQTVQLSLGQRPWFDLLDEPQKTLELTAGEVRSLNYRLRVKRIGTHEIEVAARAGETADAIRREVTVVSDGRRIEQVVNGTLEPAATASIDVPDDAIEGSAKALLKLYPSSFSQAVEGLESIFRLPYGCFEQTSSTTYPNVLALEYLRKTGKNVPAVEAKARQFIQLGYQRLLSFEVAGGGFDWFGRAPANRALTAYGLMEFRDMARVHDDVDPTLIARTSKWLLAQRRDDGSWEPDGHSIETDPIRRGDGRSRLTTTAYIAWALFENSANSAEAQSTRDYLTSHRPESIEDAYTLATVCNALLAIDPAGAAAAPYLDRLLSLKQTSTDGKQTWWSQRNSARTLFHGAGASGDIEATAVSTLALLKAKRDPAPIRGALGWLIAKRDAAGTWYSTQATVLAMKAVLLGTGAVLGGDQPRRIAVSVDDVAQPEVTIPADQSEVMAQIDLSSLISPGKHRLELRDNGGAATGFQTSFSYHVPNRAEESPGTQPLTVSLSYDRTRLSVNDAVGAKAEVVNNMQETAPMVIVDVPIPAGFVARSGDWQSLVDGGKIAKYQISANSVIVYLRALAPGHSLPLDYRLQATMPITTSVRPAFAYEYYDPGKRAATSAAQLTVVAAR